MNQLKNFQSNYLFTRCVYSLMISSPRVPTLWTAEKCNNCGSVIHSNGYRMLIAKMGDVRAEPVKIPSLALFRFFQLILRPKISCLKNPNIDKLGNIEDRKSLNES